MFTVLLSFLLTVSTYSFSHLDVEDGLSQSSVFDIEQDHIGCVWFATYEGLCRFDGNDIKVFRHEESNKESLGGNVVRQLLMDSDGYLWAATNKGFSRIDPRSCLIKNINIENRAIVGLLAEYDRRYIIAISGAHIYLLDKNNFSVSEDLSETELTENDYFFQNSHIGLLIATKDGKLDLLPAPGKKRITLSRKCIGSLRSMVASQDSCIYLGSEGEGFCKIDLRNGKLKKYPLRSLRVRAMCRDSRGDIWIGTPNNLFVFNPTTETMTEIAPDSNNPDAVSNGSFRSLFCDRTGGIWAGTFFGGVNYCSPWKSRFEAIRYASPDKDIVGCINEDEQGELWVGTFRDGVLKYNRDYSSYSKLGGLYDTKRDETKDVKIIVFEKEKVYIGTELGGLNVYDRRTGISSHINSDGLFSSVYYISRTPFGAFWLGTNKGLFRFNPSGNSFSRISDFSLIRRIHKSNAKDLWLGGDNFLARCVETTGPNGEEDIMVIRKFEDITLVQDINSIGEYVWIGSRNGLFRYSIGRKTMEKIKISDEHISVKAIEDGGNGRLWISTEDGIFCYDSSSGTSRHYGRNDGLVSTTYNIGARAKLKDGSICFGGLDGITKFNPSKIIPQTFTPNPIISHISIDGEEVEIPTDGTLHIPAGKSVILFKFSSPDYASWKNISFKYSLKGFDNKWRNADISRTATYSNLPKGRYTFKVSSSNPDGISSVSPATVTIRVHPAWYQTTVFIIFILLLLLSSLGYLIFNHIKSIREDTSEQIEGLKLRLYSMSKTDEGFSEEDALFLKKVLKVVNDNLSNDKFSAEMFAKEMGLSRTGLHTRLKAVTGESALEFIKKVRFNEACELLQRGGMTVAEVGYKVGYSSPGYFAASFKKRIGKTPREYQEITLKQK